MKEIKFTQNLLFVCSRNKWRSKTAETIFKDSPNVMVKSAGTSKVAERKISRELVSWADLIYVMERKHKEIIEEKFGSLETKIIVLEIPDEYQYMDEELIKELKDVVSIK